MVENGVLAQSRIVSLYGNVLTLGKVRLSPDTVETRTFRSFVAGRVDDCLELMVHGRNVWTNHLVLPGRPYGGV